jgi:HNH endonuclease
MKLKLLAKIKEENGKFYAPIALKYRIVDLELPSTWNYSAIEPINVNDDAAITIIKMSAGISFGTDLYIYKHRLITVEGNNVPQEELATRIKHLVLKEDKELDRIAKQVEAFENLSKTVDARREQIPESVRMFVWQRDQGKCVKCNSSEKLEFDHIIPVIKGGANTERNIQLLCENCNRSKGKDI